MTLLARYRPLWIALIALIALPFAMRLLGLTITTASMVVILAIATLGLNLLVGYTGLTSFGHSAWFGIGAYAAALAQLHWLKDQIALPILLSMLVRRGAVDRGRIFDPAPARRLLLAADARARGAHLHDRVPLDRGDRRRGRARRAEARQHRAGQPRRRQRLLHPGRADRARRAVPAAAPDALAVRPCAGGDPREPVARHVPGLSGRALQARRLRDLRGGDRARRRAARLPDLSGIRRGRLGAVLRRAPRHGGDRRHAPHPRAAARRPVLHPVPRAVFDLDRELAALVRAGVRRLRALLARRPRRHLGEADAALAPAAGRIRRDEPAQDLPGPRAAGVPAAATRAGQRARGRGRLEEVRRHSCGRECEPRHRGGRNPRADRPERRRQDQPVQRGLRPVPAGSTAACACTACRSAASRRTRSASRGSRARSRSPACSAGFRSTRTCGCRCRRAIPDASTSGATSRASARSRPRPRS